MSDLVPGSGRRLSRRERESRAYRLALVGGGAGAVFVVTGILAVLGVMGGGIPLVALIVAVVCALLFRRMVSRRA